MAIIHHLNKGLQIHLSILCFYLDRHENIAWTCVYIAWAYPRLKNVKKNICQNPILHALDSQAHRFSHLLVDRNSDCCSSRFPQALSSTERRWASNTCILFPLQHNFLISIKTVQGISSSPSSSRTALHPIQVLLFLVNMASLPTFDVTIVFVRVCWPSAKKLRRQILKSEASNAYRRLKFHLFNWHTFGWMLGLKIVHPRKINYMFIILLLKHGQLMVRALEPGFSSLGYKVSL